MNHYETLGVSRDATTDEIKQSFRRKASKAHPDRDGGDPEEMARLNRAYETLTDDARRKEYDRTGSDSVGDSTEQRMRKMLLEEFSAVLASLSDYDLVGQVRQALVKRKDEFTKTSNDLKRVEMLLKRRSGRVTKKSGDNLYEMVREARLLEARNAIAAAKKELDVVCGALVLLSEYQSVDDLADLARARVDLLFGRS